MPEAVFLHRIYADGPGQYPVTPKPNRLPREQFGHLVTVVQFDRPDFKQVFPLSKSAKFRRWELQYDLISKAHFDVLRDFFDSVRGTEGTFLFQHPVTTVSYRARFAKPVLSHRYRNKVGRLDVMVELEEA